MCRLRCMRIDAPTVASAISAGKGRESVSDLGRMKKHLPSHPHAIALALVLAFVGCRSQGHSPSDSPAESTSAKSANVVKLGAPLSSKEIVPLAAIAKQPDKYAKTSVRTEGKITAVCQAM